MKKPKISLLVIYLLLISCNDTLQEITINSSDKKIVKKYYLNSNSQKDSIETNFRKNGSVAKIIYWNNGSIDSILNYNMNNKFSNYEILKDSLLYGYNKNQELISKATINKNGNYDGLKSVYIDSIIESIVSYKNGMYDGVFLMLNKKERPQSFKFIKKEYPICSISFYENGQIKSIFINNKSNNTKINYSYLKNGRIKSKYESYKGLTTGTRYKYDDEGLLISKKEFKTEEVM